MNPWILLAAAVALIASFLAGVGVGKDLKQGEWDSAELTRAEKVIVRERVIAKEVPKIVTKVVTRDVEVEKEVERVVTIIKTVDCVLPPEFGRMLVNSANAIDGSTGGVDEAPGAYECREVLEAIAKDYGAGKRNSNRLAGLQEYVRTVTEAKSE